MGKVRTEIVKRMARDLLSRYPDRFTTDFEENKRAASEVIIFKTKRLRNRVAGYITSLKRMEVKRAAKAAEVSMETAPQPAA